VVLHEHYVDPDTQVAEDQGTTWLNFALNAQCKQRPSGTRTMSRMHLPTVDELRAKAKSIIEQREDMERRAQQNEESDMESGDQD
jgi:hypothetical protein